MNYLKKAIIELAAANWEQLIRQVGINNNIDPDEFFEYVWETYAQGARDDASIMIDYIEERTGETFNSDDAGDIITAYFNELSNDEEGFISEIGGHAEDYMIETSENMAEEEADKPFDDYESAGGYFTSKTDRNTIIINPTKKAKYYFNYYFELDRADPNYDIEKEVKEAQDNLEDIDDYVTEHQFEKYKDRYIEEINDLIGFLNSFRK